MSKPKDRHKPRRNEPRFDLRSHLYRIFGVDLAEVPSVSSLTAHTLLTEVGPDLRRFPNAGAFASWLGLCPDNRISGGRVLSVATRRVKNRLAIALRMAAFGSSGAGENARFTLDSSAGAGAEPCAAERRRRRGRGYGRLTKTECQINSELLQVKTHRCLTPSKSHSVGSLPPCQFISSNTRRLA